jgi:hypothetical protein
MKMDIDRHGPRSMPSNCKNLNPPNFSLPTTFKYCVYKLFLKCRTNAVFVVLENVFLWFSSDTSEKLYK